MVADSHLAWAVPNHGAKYGGALAGAPTVTRDQSAAAPSAGPALTTKEPPWSPRNPLFWFGIIAAATFGFMGYSTTVRVGPAKGSVELGKT